MPESFVTPPPPDLASRLLPLLLDEMTAGIALFDAGGRRQLANTRFDALLGTPADGAVAGAPLARHLTLLPPEVAGALGADIARGTRSQLDWASAGGRHLDLTHIPAAGLGTLLLLRDGTARRVADAGLAEQRARMEHMLSNLEDAVVLMDPAGVIVASSVTSGELLGLPAELVRPGATHQDILRHFYRRGDYGFEVQEEEFVRMRRAGIIAAGTLNFAAQMPGDRWVEYRFRALTDGHLLINVRDITALKHREIELERERAEAAEQRDRLDTLLRHLRDFVVLFDDDDRVLINSDSGALMGMTAEQVAPGVHMADVIAIRMARGEFGPIPPDPLAAAQERVAMIRARGGARSVQRITSGAFVDFEFRLLPNGRMLLFGRDVTELEQARRAEEEERATLQAIVDNLPDGLMLFDADFRWRIANRQLMEFQRFPPEVAHPGASGHDIIRFQTLRGDFGPPPGEPAALEALVAERVAMMRKPGGNRYVRHTAGGYWIEFNMIPMPDGGLLAFYRDISLPKRQEAQIEAERTLLREILDACDALIVVSDADSNVLLANNRQRDIMETPDHLYRPGTNLADAIRHRYRAGIYGFDQDETTMVAERLANAFRGDPAQGGVVRYTRTMPSGRSVEHMFTPISGGRLVGFHRDITALKQQEAALAAERSLLREMLESMDSMIVLLDGSARVILSNGHGKELLGIPEELVEVGGSLRESMRYMYRRGDFGFDQPEEYWVQGRVDAVLSGRKLRVVRPAPAGRWIEFAYTPISGGRVVAQGRDITALKLTEQAALAAQAEVEAERGLLREVLEAIDALVILADADDTIILSNMRHTEMMDAPPELYRTGVNFAESLRWRYRKGVYGFAQDEASTVAARIANARQGGTVRHTRLMPAGRWVESVYTPLSLGRMVGVSRDVTELKESERQAQAARAEAEAARDAAEAAAQAKSAFLAAMSHEIRTPMNGVLGMLEVLGRSELQAEQNRAVAVMRESAHSLLRIIDDVLDFSKIEAGRMELEAVPLSLADVLEGTIATLAPEAQRRGLTLFADPPKGGPTWLMGDATRIRQILFNLTGNALKFTERGYVRVSLDLCAEGPTAAVTLAVEDSGIGMDEATLARLFQPFTQADSSTTRRFGGSGLGLSIVRRLAELMGGQVRAESMHGRGSRFSVTLRLPVTEAPAEPEARALAVSGGMATEGGVLVVDDHPVNREVLTRQLELLGVNAADTAADGEAALALWRLTRPATVLLDIHMPVMDGFELARAIRAEEQRLGLPRTALIAVTANALKGEAERCYAAGMDGFVPKPVTLEALAHALGHAGPPRAIPTKPALFDPAALRGLFGDDPERFSSILDSFATQARHDIAGMADAPAEALRDRAHRLKGSARMVGARRLADAAAEVEAASREGQAMPPALGALPALLEETLTAARSLLGGG